MPRETERKVQEILEVSTKQAALHMHPSYEKNLELFKNSEFESIKGSFGITRMMIEGNSEIKNVFPADVVSSLWENPVLLKEQAIKWTKARVHGTETGDLATTYRLVVAAVGLCRHAVRNGGGFSWEWSNGNELWDWAVVRNLFARCGSSSCLVSTAAVGQ